jgi:2-methylaconitate isomerase
VPARLVRAEAGAELRIGHPSGVILVDAAIERRAEGPHVTAATVFRSARRLFQGEVLYRPLETGLA